MKKVLASLLLMVFIMPFTLQADEVRASKSKFFYDFNDKSLENWKAIDRDNDGKNWLISEEGYIYSESSDATKPNNVLMTVDKYTIYATSKISFDVRPADAGSSIERYGVGIVYSLDGEFFQTIQDETELASATDWNTIEVSLSYIANKEVYIGILHYTFDNQGTILVDNVKLMDGRLPTAENVVAEEVENNINITWEAPAEESANYDFNSYRVYRSRSGEEAVMVANNLTSTSYEDTDWSELEWGIYQYGVAALHQQKTRGAAVTLLEEGFETAAEGNIPEGWTILSEPASTTSIAGPWKVSKSIPNIANPNSGEQLAFSYGGYDIAEFYLITPAIDLTKALEPTLEFNYFSKGLFEDPGDPLFIKYSESATGPWTQIYADTANFIWEKCTLDLTSLSGRTVYLAFVHKDLKAGNFGIGLDDIKLSAQLSETAIPIASDIVWSNTIDKDMNTSMTLTVATDDNASAEGAIITLENINDATYTYKDTLDATGKHQFTEVRRGSYEYTVVLEGYHPLSNKIDIYEETSIGCILEKLPEAIEGLYVSPTAWAMWELEGENLTFDVKLNDEIVAENITDKYFQHDTKSLLEGETYTTTVLPKGSDKNVIMEYTWVYEECFNYASAVNFKAVKEENNAVLSWTMPVFEGEPEPAFDFSVDFDNGTLEGWTTIDADGDKRNWLNTAGFADQGFGYGNTYCVASISYDTELGAFNPDNYLVSDRKYTITASSKLRWIVAAQSKYYPNEHYGIAISRKSNNKANDFEVIFEETLTAGETDSTDIQSQWFERELDLSAYAGENIYIAVRHYDSKNNSWLLLDNVSLTSTSRGTLAGKGDWLYYDNGVMESANGNFDYSTGTTKPTQIYWAIMFPTDVISDYAKRNITKVALFDNSAHKGAFSIHFGGDNAPGEMVYVQSYETTGKKSYIEIELDEPVTISGKDNVWIQFSNEYGSGEYVAAYSTDIGDPNSRWRSDNGLTWYDANWFGQGWYGTWMIRAFVEEKDETVIEDPEVSLVEPIGTMIYRNGKLITPKPIKETTFTDAIAEGEEEIEYSIRVVYGGKKDVSYYAMSCPTRKTFEVFTPLVCEQPKDLYGATTFNKDGTFGATLVWPYMKEWLYYDDGEILEYGVGGGGAIYWGIMFPANDLTDYAGGSITEVSLFDVEECSVTLSISYGGDFAPGTAVHMQSFEFEGSFDYKNIKLTAPIPVTGEENIWVTLYQTGGQFPAAVTKNTGNPNGRWCSLDGNSWGDLYAMNAELDYTWYMRAYVSNEAKGGQVYEIEPLHGDAGSELSSIKFEPSKAIATADDEVKLDHYNIYRSTTNGNYQRIGQTTANRYFDEIEKGTYYYQVRAVYSRGEETCESEPATAYDDPSKDYVVVEVTAIDENGVKGMMVYPNPAKDNLNITAEGLNRITICNVLGQIVYDRSVNSDNEIINMSQYEAGIYMVRIVTENGIAVKRISVTK